MEYLQRRIDRLSKTITADTQAAKALRGEGKGADDPSTVDLFF